MHWLCLSLYKLINPCAYWNVHIWPHKKRQLVNKTQVHLSAEHSWSNEYVLISVLVMMRVHVLINACSDECMFWCVCMFRWVHFLISVHVLMSACSDERVCSDECVFLYACVFWWLCVLWWACVLWWVRVLVSVRVLMGAHCDRRTFWWMWMFCSLTVVKWSSFTWTV